MADFPPAIEELYQELRELKQRENEIREEIAEWLGGVSRTLGELGLDVGVCEPPDEATEIAESADEVTEVVESAEAKKLKRSLTGRESQREMILAVLAATGRGMRAAEINELLRGAGFDEIPEANIRAILSKSKDAGTVEWVRQGVYKLSDGTEVGSDGSNRRPYEADHIGATPSITRERRQPPNG